MRRARHGRAPLADDVALAQSQFHLRGGADRHGEPAVSRDNAGLADLQRVPDEGIGELVGHSPFAGAAALEADLAFDQALFEFPTSVELRPERETEVQDGPKLRHGVMSAIDALVAVWRCRLAPAFVPALHIRDGTVTEQARADSAFDHLEGVAIGLAGVGRNFVVRRLRVYAVDLARAADRPVIGCDQESVSALIF